MQLTLHPLAQIREPMLLCKLQDLGERLAQAIGIQGAPDLLECVHRPQDAPRTKGRQSMNADGSAGQAGRRSGSPDTTNAVPRARSRGPWRSRRRPRKLRGGPWHLSINPWHLSINPADRGVDSM